MHTFQKTLIMSICLFWMGILNHNVHNITVFLGCYCLSAVDDCQANAKGQELVYSPKGHLRTKDIPCLWI